jgi:hypothetical protein
LTCTARKHKRTVNINKEQYEKLIKLGCFYCQRDISKDAGYGLNRINNEPDYSMNNVKPCCKFCNKMMNNFSKEDILISAKGIIKKLEEIA